MNIERHTEVTNSLPALMYTAQDLFQKGWELDPDMPPQMFLFSYQADFIRQVGTESEGELSLEVESEEAPQRNKSGRPRKQKE